MTARSILAVRLRSAVALLLTALGVLVGASHVSAQTAPPVEWSTASVGGPARRLYTPTSGALFVQTRDGLARSDDGGVTWRAIQLPAPPVDVPGAVVVDPTNHATVYVAASDGIYKTDDDSQSWRLLAPVDPKRPRFQALAVSPADPNVLYTFYSSEDRQALIFRRSADGGATWVEPDPFWRNSTGRGVMPCWWSVYIVQPHLADPNGLDTAIFCDAKGLYVRLRRSLDGGATWQQLSVFPQAAPVSLVGNQPDAPGRLYVGANADPARSSGYQIARSDDDGASWTTIEEHTAESRVNAEPNIGIGGLAIDPTRSDRLLVGLNPSGRGAPAPAPPRLHLSEDAGATWADVTPPDLTKINDVKFGVDGRTMFVATDAGVWRGSAP